MSDNLINLELLSPARDADTAIAAINHGADAVYIGAPAFGARAAASNSLDDIRRVVAAAEPFGVRIYVTFNTIIYEHELAEAATLIRQLYDAGVDALIVQDLGILNMDIPPIELHASTQTDARTPQKIKMLAEAGFSQIVVPREFTPAEIAEAAKAAGDVPLEVFVHGALCVSYSGDCQAGYMLASRSANRGQCPQICRHLFTLTDADGREVAPPDGKSATRYWLSLADMNRLDHLAELVEAGARSFKIEGRLKNISYVKNVTAAYSKALDTLIASADGCFRRSSFGSVDYRFTPDVAQSFNRGFTPFFIAGRHRADVTSWLTPKSIGQPIGKVKDVKALCIELEKISADLNNGDGLGWFDRNGSFHGFRLNRVDGRFLHAAPGTKLLPSPGTQIYRNLNSAHEAIMDRPDTARRTITVDFTLRHLPDGRIAIDVTDERGMHVSVGTSEAFTDIARSPQAEARMKVMSRLGETIYRMNTLDDRLGDTFIAASSLTMLRRQALEALDTAWHIAHRRKTRRPSRLSKQALSGLETTYHDNVANSLASQFYTAHGAIVGQRAAEVETPRGDVRVMSTRYCIRRELGACLRTQNADRQPRQPLYLQDESSCLRIEFDCARCGMNIYLTENKEKIK